jgi:hypothetical protein
MNAVTFCISLCIWNVLSLSGPVYITDESLSAALCHKTARWHCWLDKGTFFWTQCQMRLNLDSNFLVSVSLKSIPDYITAARLSALLCRREHADTEDWMGHIFVERSAKCVLTCLLAFFSFLYHIFTIYFIIHFALRFPFMPLFFTLNNLLKHSGDFCRNFWQSRSLGSEFLMRIHTSSCCLPEDTFSCSALLHCRSARIPFVKNYFPWWVSMKLNLYISTLNY